MSLIDGPFVLAEGRVREGQLEFECPVCQKDMTMGRTWSPTWTMVKGCSGCGASVEVIRAAPEFAPGEPLVVQPRRIEAVPAAPAPPPSLAAVTIFFATAALVLAAAIDGGRHPLLKTAAIGMSVVSAIASSLYLRTRAQHAEAQRVDRARAYRLGIQEASYLTRDLREELDWFRQQTAWLRGAAGRIPRMATLLEESWSRRAAAAFWQTVANVSEDVGHSVYVSRELWRRYKNYTAALHAREHNFPAVPFAPADVPPLADAFRNLERLVRQAESDPDFAAALRQRNDSASLIAERGTAAAIFEDRAYYYEELYEALIRSAGR